MESCSSSSWVFPAEAQLLAPKPASALAALKQDLYPLQISKSGTDLQRGAVGPRELFPVLQNHPALWGERSFTAPMGETRP